MIIETEGAVAAATRRWVEQAVIGLNLCPFAKAVHVKNQVRYAVSDARSMRILHADLAAELRRLHEADPAQIDTTLLIHPRVLQDFLDYNDFLDVADTLLEEMDLVGKIQIASFHPRYRFANTEENDIANCTNRSPYPMLHLLREASIERAVAAFPDAEEIFGRNIDTMRRLGESGWNALTLAIAAPGMEKN